MFAAVLRKCPNAGPKIYGLQRRVKVAKALLKEEFKGTYTELLELKTL